MGVDTERLDMLAQIVGTKDCFVMEYIEISVIDEIMYEWSHDFTLVMCETAEYPIFTFHQFIRVKVAELCFISIRTI